MEPNGTKLTKWQVVELRIRFMLSQLFSSLAPSIGINIFNNTLQVKHNRSDLTLHRLSTS